MFNYQLYLINTLPYITDPCLVLFWCLLVSVSLRVIWAGIRPIILDIDQANHTQESQKLDLAARRVSIVLSATPYLSEVPELRRIIAQLEKDTEPELSAAFDVIRRLKALPKTPIVREIRRRAVDLIVARGE